MAVALGLIPEVEVNVGGPQHQESATTNARVAAMPTDFWPRPGPYPRNPSSVVFTDSLVKLR